MAYIDREQVCENCNNKNYCEKEKCPVYKVSTADVVPKSEVEKLSHKCDDCAGCTQWTCDCAIIELEVAREIFAELLKQASLRFDGFRNTIIFPLDYYNELKKKYTEDKR